MTLYYAGLNNAASKLQFFIIFFSFLHRYPYHVQGPSFQLVTLRIKRYSGVNVLEESDRRTW